MKNGRNASCKKVDEAGNQNSKTVQASNLVSLEKCTKAMANVFVNFVIAGILLLNCGPLHIIIKV